MEQNQAVAQSDAALQRQIDLAMWRLENLVAPVRAAEAVRPLEHYRPFYSPAIAITPSGEYMDSQSVLEPSPLLTAQLPDWQLFHFHVSRTGGWSSPQVVSGEPLRWAVHAAFPDRSSANRRLQQLLDELARDIPPDTLLARLGDGNRVPDDLRCYVCPADSAPFAREQLEETKRQNQQFAVQNWVQFHNTGQQARAPEDYFYHSAHQPPLAGCSACLHAPPGLPPVVPIWLPSLNNERRLAWVRPITSHAGLEVQGVLLDWEKLKALLTSEVSDLVPGAVIEPDPSPSERGPTKMVNLPVQLNVAARSPVQPGGWTSLRIGLASVWLAALVAIAFVGWGGWALLELSERRRQFVAAITHELRTPVTTFRLYLDMLVSGLVKDEARRDEYIRTLHIESDRLASFIDNVLNYGRLENGRPNLHRTSVPVQQLLAEMRQLFEPRTAPAGKLLVVEDNTPPGAQLYTDISLVRQILANLLDNAFKHTAGTSDTRVWLRANQQASGQFEFHVEDGGPGIRGMDQNRIFSPFWRGSTTKLCSSPGVGLGLALARRWATLLGGTLRVKSPVQDQGGARFTLLIRAPDKNANSASATQN
jgi:signal transduction histidine kinase